jgi:hypothetical protein
MRRLLLIYVTERLVIQKTFGDEKFIIYQMLVANTQAKEPPWET